MRTIKIVSNHSIRIILLAVLCNISAAQIIYVDDDATGANNGSSWENAYVYLQDALADANSVEKHALSLSNGPVEIRVAGGIYKPDQGAGQIPGDREATFNLINGVTLAGGYAGAADPNARDIELYETILSGDLNGNDVQVADILDLLYETTRTENSYHVVSTYYCNESTVLDGFIINAGNANNETVQHVDSGGGGFYNYYSNLMVINCIFMHNSARWDGGGMHNIHSSPLITNCIFEKNLAGTSSGGHGGGINNSGSEPILTNCIFRGNRAGQGGGINAICCAPTAINCHFIDNSANFGAGIQYKGSIGPEFTSCHFKNNNASRGAGARFINSSPVVKNCIFTNNSANNYGGALALTNMSSPVLANCTFIANTASHGCAIGCDHALYGPSEVNIINSILWNITEEIWNNDGSLINIAYCNIQSGQDSVYDPCEAIIWGEGNINVDPLFVDQGHWDTNFTRETTDDDFWVDGDYHLKSQTGRYDPNSESWVRDEVTSPCINAGDPNTPVGDELEPNGGRINMGAYGGTDQASKSFSDEPMVVNVNDSDNGGQVVLQQGQILAVTLESNPTTGYSWDPVEKQNSILEKFGDTLYFPSEPDDEIVGAGGWEILYFKSISVGQETLELVYRRPWETDVEPINTFSIEVVVN